MGQTKLNLMNCKTILSIIFSTHGWMGRLYTETCTTTHGYAIKYACEKPRSQKPKGQRPKAKSLALKSRSQKPEAKSQKPKLDLKHNKNAWGWLTPYAEDRHPQLFLRCHRSSAQQSFFSAHIRRKDIATDLGAQGPPPAQKSMRVNQD